MMTTMMIHKQPMIVITNNFDHHITGIQYNNIATRTTRPTGVLDLDPAFSVFVSMACACQYRVEGYRDANGFIISHLK